jgi:anti-anti-sigma factor
MDGSPFPGYFDVSIERDEGTPVARLQGELDLAGAAHLEELLVGLTSPTVVVDLSRLQFIDSSGFGALLRAQGRLEGDGRHLSFQGPLRPEVARTLSMLGMPDIVRADHPEGGA